VSTPRSSPARTRSSGGTGGGAGRGAEQRRDTVRPAGDAGETPGKEAADARVAAADNPAERAGAAGSHPDAPEPSGRDLADNDDGTDTGPSSNSSIEREA
jgi:NADH-quinone oxidoreductase subunit E